VTVVEKDHGQPTVWAFRLVVHKVAIQAILWCDLLFTSRIYRVIDTAIMQPLLLGILAGIACAYTVLAVLERRYTEVLVQVLYVGLVATEMLHFGELVSTPVNPNAAFQYLLVTNFISFGTFITAGLSSFVLWQLLRVSFAYACFYAAIAVLYTFNSVPNDIVSALILNDVERGERLFNHLGATAFAWFYFLSQVRRKPQIASLTGMLVCGLSIYLTLSRVYIVCIVLVSSLWLARFRLSTVRVICLAVLWVASLTYFYGLVEPAWNPFALFSTDTSGSVRADEYETNRYFVQRDFIWGAGIPSEQKDVEKLTGNYFFAASDLGTFGVWFDFGLFGLGLFIAGSHVVCHVVDQVEERFRAALVLTGCMFASYSCIAPAIFYPTGGTFFAIILAYWFRAKVAPD
jgi:hypothetical protein